MDSLECFLNDDVEQQYFDALKLNDETSKSDPENEIFKSMYKAREIWISLKTKIKKQVESESGVTSDWIYLDAALDLKLGINYMDTEEKSSAETHLKSCLVTLESEKMSLRGCNAAQIALNQLGILYTERRDPEKGLEYLQEAESLYKKFKETIGGSPWSVDDLFSLETYSKKADGSSVEKCNEKFESTYTHTLYYLAQVYRQMDKCALSAAYCQETLHRQLDMNLYEAVDWSMNAATLAQYYFSSDNFRMSRHCLASSEFILRETGDTVGGLRVKPTTGETQTSLNDRERVPKAWADLYRCWTKYAMALLEYSMNRLYEKLEEDDTLKANHNDENQDDGGTKSSSENHENGFDDKGKKEDEQMLFNLELTSIESRITDVPVCIFDEARQVFLKTQSWLNSAKDFYVIDGHCTDYVDIVRDQSQLYKLLAFFEPDFERQCKMHKRRADMLEDILKQLNPQFYLLVCRQLMFELAEIYSSMLDNKLALIEGCDVPPSEHACKKINLLSQQSIDKFQMYIDSLKGPDGKLPEKFPDENERTGLVAHFYIGRLYSKIIEREIPEHLKNLKKSMDNYRFLVDYCARNPSAREKVRNEVEICEEMSSLLPAKMDKIRACVE